MKRKERQLYVEQENKSQKRNFRGRRQENQDIDKADYQALQEKKISWRIGNEKNKGERGNKGEKRESARE